MRRVILLAGMLSAYAAVAVACDIKCVGPLSGVNQPRCDLICYGPNCTAPSNCDQCGASGPGSDGLCVMCVPDGATTTTVTGTAGKDWVCLGQSNLTIAVNTKGGDDYIQAANLIDVDDNSYIGTGGTLQGGDYPIGTLVVTAGGGDDRIHAGRGDDVLKGEAGNDVIVSCGGRNAVSGGPGFDYIETTTQPTPSCAPADDAVGSIYCGNDDYDGIYVRGPAHQCIDAGAGQFVSSSSDDCTYTFAAGSRLTPTSFDIGTVRNCAEPNIGQNNEPCGCD